MDQTARDWSTIVGGWIKEAEKQMDEAYRTDNGPLYTATARWHREFKQARQLLDPTAEVREASQALGTAIRHASVTMAETAKGFEEFGRLMREAHEDHAATS